MSGYGIRSVEKAFLVLEVIRDVGGTAKLRDIALATEMSVSTVHGILDTLVALGYVIRQGLDYSIGIRLHHLGKSSEQRETELLRLFEPALQAANRLCKMTTILAVACGTKTYVSLKVLDKMGSEEARRELSDAPITFTAIGKIFLAHDSALARRISIQTPITFDMQEELKRVRDQGWAIEDSDRSQERCLAIPLRYKGALVAALGMKCLAGDACGIDLEPLAKRTINELYPLLSL